MVNNVSRMFPKRLRLKKSKIANELLTLAKRKWFVASNWIKYVYPSE